MEQEKKMTKKDYYNEIKEIIEKTNIAEKDELIEFIDKQVSQIDTKAEKAKERAAEKKVAGDEIRETIKSLLTNEYQTADEITSKINDEEITRAKVIARLTQLVNLNEAEKTDIKTEDGKNLKAYKIAK